MAEDNLREFLREQADSLNSLLSLTPAKMMFGEDVSDQWQRKKQTPEQKRAARMAKLDPANWKSAKDVYDERGQEALKKRKREAGEDDEPSVNGTKQEHSKIAIKKAKVGSADKNASLGKISEKAADEEVKNANLKKKLKKRANKLKRNEEQRLRKEAKRAEAASQTEPQANADEPNRKKSKQSTNADGESKQKKRKSLPQPQPDAMQDNDLMQVDDFSALQEIEDSGLLPSEEGSTVEEDEHDSEEAHEDGNADDNDDDYSTIASAEEAPEVFSPPQESASSSVSSAPLPASSTSHSQQVATKKPGQAPKADTKLTNSLSASDKQAARERLQQQISNFRTQRKADDKPPRSRADLLAQRRREEDERKAAKKEQKRKEKAEEAKRQEEEMVRRFSPGGSGSLLGSPRSPIIYEGGGNAFSFGRIGFEDGTQLDSKDLTLAADRKKKGPQDAATALKAARNKDARLSGLDEEKRRDIAEKDMWLNAKKKAFGEKVKDDTSLLKKALKRQEKQKSKSGSEWDKRVESVQSGQEARQKKRNDNIQARKDSKVAKKTGKKVKRPGFEGSFRGRSGKTKKK